MRMMKYATNHPWKFRSIYPAWLVGFTQFFMVISVEAINLIVLISNETVMDIIMNFLALVIIADFDDYFAQTLFDNDIFKKLDG